MALKKLTPEEAIGLMNNFNTLVDQYSQATEWQYKKFREDEMRNPEAYLASKDMILFYFYSKTENAPIIGLWQTNMLPIPVIVYVKKPTFDNIKEFDFTAADKILYKWRE